MTTHQALKELKRVAEAYANGAEEKRRKRIFEALSVLRLVVGPPRPSRSIGTRMTQAAAPVDTRANTYQQLFLC
jgi:hypothetical protein